MENHKVNKIWVFTLLNYLSYSMTPNIMSKIQSQFTPLLYKADIT